jgi:hypothetical protein
VIDAEMERPKTAEQVLDQLEQRAGPEGRKLFERFLKQLNKLQVEQLEAQAKTGDVDGGG